MVFFVCGGCGDTMKKSMVENHTSRCRSCQYITCMDCSKEFWGNDYAAHTQCITEDQKYGGTNYVHKEAKGQAKQDQWIALIKEKLATNANVSGPLRAVFNFLVAQNNVPRKKAKFLNFVQNSGFKNVRVNEEAWLYFEEVQNNIRQSNNINKSDISKSENKEPVSSNIQASVSSSVEPVESMQKSKRERKEERQRKQTKLQKKDKRKRDALEAEESNTVPATEKPKKKKKKRIDSEVGVTNQENEEPALENGKDFPNVEDDHKSSPFKWKTAINTVLQGAPEEGMKMKKLKRKVFALYMESKVNNAHRKSDVEIEALISKKLQMRNDKYMVVKDRVKLRSN